MVPKGTVHGSRNGDTDGDPHKDGEQQSKIEPKHPSNPVSQDEMNGLSGYMRKSLKYHKPLHMKTPPSAIICKLVTRRKPVIDVFVIVVVRPSDLSMPLNQPRL
mmetsp:Transcript_3065/g.6568  ORF Transcript_3065/g.6568 Transcript_3065/m.6568 type:complete len:104 (-) Transcript_3065:744-1055(-)